MDRILPFQGEYGPFFQIHYTSGECGCQEFNETLFSAKEMTDVLFNEADIAIEDRIGRVNKSKVEKKYWNKYIDYENKKLNKELVLEDGVDVLNSELLRHIYPWLYDYQNFEVYKYVMKNGNLECCLHLSC